MNNRFTEASRQNVSPRNQVNAHEHACVRQSWMIRATSNNGNDRATSPVANFSNSATHPVARCYPQKASDPAVINTPSPRESNSEDQGRFLLRLSA